MKDVKYRVRFKPDQKMFDVAALIRTESPKELRVFPKTSITLEWEVLNRAVEDWDIVLMQSTWAFDKNWVEIFDGDIVKGSKIWELHHEPCVVFYDKFKLWFYATLARNWEDWFCWKTGSRREYMVEQKHKIVIGNIYENPDLIN